MVAAEETTENVEGNGSASISEEERLLGTPTEEQTVEATDLIGEKPLEAENGQVKSDYEEESQTKTRVRRLSEIVEELQGSEDISCGVWCLKGSFMQKLANKKVYVLLYGLVGCVMGACYSYFNGTITTIEKRFKIPTTNSGIIMVGTDISQLFLCISLNYYAGKGHRPRWMAFGVYTVVVFCLMNALPHFLYGPGESALLLTEEYGSLHDPNSTAFLIDKENRKLICQSNSTNHECEENSGNLAPQVILFMANLISGGGGSLYYTLGVAYMDDNIKKTKTPALVSLSYFLRMLGPAAGYTIASACLSTYISPSLTPTITPSDPRWLGAWWIGWLIIGVALFFSASILALFPKTLPRAAARKIQAVERRKAGLAADPDDSPEHDDTPTSFKDMTVGLIRLFKNKTYMCNTFSSVFYIFGYMPYWVFMPKYIETIYKQTASTAAFITGTIGLVFSGIGILSAGMFISKFKPTARFLAAWNVFVGVVSVAGMLSYALLGCPVNDQQGALLASGQMDTKTTCNADCYCDYVKYSPVCSPDGRTFISPCHAGCRDFQINSNGTKVYLDCACVPKPPGVLALGSSDSNLTLDTQAAPEDNEELWVLKEGLCPVDCSSHFLMFLVVMCTLKFSGGSGRTSNFLVSVRCVEEKDKTLSMGLGMMLLSLMAFIPSPILFGYIIDQCCLVWGRTCSGTGNCWLYNAEMLRTVLNLTGAGFVTIGTMFDFGVWYYVKNLEIFDEEVELEIVPQRQKTQRK